MYHVENQYYMQPLIKGNPQAKTQLYKAWIGMKTRCDNLNADNYGRYGGKGVKYCNGFSSFLKYKEILGDRPTSKHTVDRINSNLHYSCGDCDECHIYNWPMNVKWSTPKEQTLNSSAAKFLTYKGQTMCLKDWAKKIGVSRLTLSARINTYKWSVEDALALPRLKSYQYKKYKNGNTK